MNQRLYLGFCLSVIMWTYYTEQRYTSCTTACLAPSGQVSGSESGKVIFSTMKKPLRTYCSACQTSMHSFRCQRENTDASMHAVFETTLRQRANT